MMNNKTNNKKQMTQQLARVWAFFFHFSLGAKKKNEQVPGTSFFWRQRTKERTATQIWRRIVPKDPPDLQKITNKTKETKQKQKAGSQRVGLGVGDFVFFGFFAWLQTIKQTKSGATQRPRILQIFIKTNK